MPSNTTYSARDTSLPLLNRMPLLASLPEHVLERLAEKVTALPASKGDLICREGDPGDSLFIVESGLVEIVVEQKDGEELTVAELGPGEFFGELALLDGEPRSASARAASRSVLVSVSREQFLDVLRERIAIENLLLVLSQRLRAADKLVADRAVDNAKLLEVARRDTLTGLGNQRKLEEDLQDLQARATRYGHTYAVAMLEADSFDRYVDLHGEERSQQTLRDIAAAINFSMRSADAAYRPADGQFVVILPEQSPETAAIGVNRIRERVRELRIVHDGNEPERIISLSAGVAAMQKGENSERDWGLKAAGRALERAKDRGANHLEIAAQS